MDTSIDPGLSRARVNRHDAIVVLLADDDEEDRAMATDAMREARIVNELHAVEDGEALMDYLTHRGRFAPPTLSPRPDLVLLDLNMPRKGGREVLREMKSDPVLRSIPVVVLTTSRAEEDVERIYNLGANSFITKPVTFEGLVDAMKVIGEYWFQIVRLPKELE